MQYADKCKDFPLITFQETVSEIQLSGINGFNLRTPLCTLQAVID